MTVSGANRVAVLGAGAVGCWLAAVLSDAGIAVSLVARGASLEALRRHGLRIRRDGQERNLALPAGAAAAFGPQDFVIVATKAQDVPRALPDLLPLLHARTAVVSALNGLPWWFSAGLPAPLHGRALQSVDPGGLVAAAITATRAIGCVVHASVTRTGPGCVRVNDVDRLIIGEASGPASERVRWLVEACNRGGVAAVASDSIRLDVWTKLWGNMTMNPLSALTRATTGALLDDPQVRALCLRMMGEMAAVGARLDLPLAIGAAERMALTRRLGDFRTSMLEDLENGRPLELEPQLGAVVEVAQLAGVPAPCCAQVLALTRLLSGAPAAR